MMIHSYSREANHCVQKSFDIFADGCSYFISTPYSWMVAYAIMLSKWCPIIPSSKPHRFEPLKYLFLHIMSIRGQTNMGRDITTLVHVSCPQVASAIMGG